MQNDGPDLIECMERIVRRDARALEFLYDRFSNVLFRFVLAFVKRREDAEDVLGEIFFQVWRKAETFDRDKGSVYGWLLSIARSRAIDRLRSKQFKNDRMEDPGLLDMDDLAGASSVSPLDLAERSMMMKHVRSAMDSIPSDQRRVIEEAYLGGFSQSQVANRLGLPLGTVKTRMRDGMRTLQSILKVGGAADG
ncbi:MAG: polymerase sigma-70 factor, subfamily [Fibrobacteres bacterium]|nr:polymerase sigma-70 factor, subfamily [Fibrobacterota bacterium]